MGPCSRRQTLCRRALPVTRSSTLWFASSAAHLRIASVTAVLLCPGILDWRTYIRFPVYLRSPFMPLKANLPLLPLRGLRSGSKPLDCSNDSSTPLTLFNWIGSTAPVLQVVFSGAVQVLRETLAAAVSGSKYGSLSWTPARFSRV